MARRLAKVDRHWRYWCKLGSMPYNQFLRHMAVWERFYGVWPRGFQFDFSKARPDGSGMDGKLSFEKPKN